VLYFWKLKWVEAIIQVAKFSISVFMVHQFKFSIYI